MTKAQERFLNVCRMELEQNGAIIMDIAPFQDADSNHYANGCYTPVDEGDMDYDDAFAKCLPSVDAEEAKEAFRECLSEEEPDPVIRKMLEEGWSNIHWMLSLPERVLNRSGEKVYSMALSPLGLDPYYKFWEEREYIPEDYRYFADYSDIRILAGSEAELYYAVTKAEGDMGCIGKLRIAARRKYSFLSLSVVRKDWEKFYIGGKETERRYTAYTELEKALKNKEKYKALFKSLMEKDVRSGSLKEGRYTVYDSIGNCRSFVFRSSEEGVMFYCTSYETDAFYGGDLAVYGLRNSQECIRVPVHLDCPVPRMAGSLFSDYASGCDRLDRLVKDGEEFSFFEGMKIDVKTWEYEVKAGYHVEFEKL